MYNREAYVDVYPFTRQAEGEQVIVGRVETGTFLALPCEALEVLDGLAAGKSVGEVQDLFQEKHGETPEMEEFLGLLESKGFVWPRNQARPDATAAGSAAEPPAARRVRYHFANFPEDLAQKLFGRAALAGFAVLTVLACGALALAPSLIPGPSALFFPDHRTLSILALMTISYAALFVHEMAHLVAARAVGVKSRMGISHRLWYLVAETDLTGLWSVPKRQRYLPLLAGMGIDVACSDLLILLLFAVHMKWIVPPVFVARLLPAILFSFLMRLVWQLFLFLRTDLYYVITNLLSCKSLLQDTENFLRNRLARVFSFISPVDQSGVPAAEMKVVRVYAVVWVVGRAAALALLLLITIPLMVRYIGSIATTLRAGFSVSPYHFVDSLILAVYSLIPLTLGTALWIRSMLQRKRS